MERTGGWRRDGCSNHQNRLDRVNLVFFKIKIHFIFLKKQTLQKKSEQRFRTTNQQEKKKTNIRFFLEKKQKENLAFLKNKPYNRIKVWGGGWAWHKGLSGRRRLSHAWMQRYVFTGNRSQHGAAEENPTYRKRLEKREKNHSPHAGRSDKISSLRLKQNSDPPICPHACSGQSPTGNAAPTSTTQSDSAALTEKKSL